MVEPLAGWRHVEVTDRRTKLDYTKQIRWLVDRVYPDAEYIRIVQGNLNTHTPAAIYEASPSGTASYPATSRVSSHAQTRQLVEYDRNRDRPFSTRLLVPRRIDCVGTLRRRINALEMERNRVKNDVA